MGGVCSYESRLAGSWIGPKVSTARACRQLQRPQTGNLKVSEILAHAAALAVELFGRSAHVSRFGVEEKVLIDMGRQIHQCVGPRPSRSKGFAGIIREFGGGFDAG